MIVQLRLDGGLDVKDRWAKREGMQCQRFYDYGLRFDPSGQVHILRSWGRLPGGQHPRSRDSRYPGPEEALVDLVKELRRRARRGYRRVR